MRIFAANCDGKGYTELGKTKLSGKKRWAILVVLAVICVAAGGIYDVYYASGIDETEEVSDAQGDEVQDDDENTFEEDGTTQISTDSQLPDFAVGAVVLTVEEVYVEAGDTVEEGTALYKLTDESMENMIAYYADAIASAEDNLASVQLDYEAGVLEAENELQTTTTAAETALDVYEASMEELENDIAEKQDAYDEAIYTIIEYQTAIDDGTYYTKEGIDEKQAAVTSAEAALTEKQAALSEAQSAYEAAQAGYDADMAVLQTQTQGEADYDTLLASVNQVVADYDAVQTASANLTTATQAAAEAQSELETGQLILDSATQSYNKSVSEANEKITELTNSLEQLLEEAETAEREAETKKIEIQNTYDTAVLEGEYADATYQAAISQLETALSSAQETLDELEEEQAIVLSLEDGVICASQSGTLASVTYEAEDILYANVALVSYYNTDTIMISVEVSQENIANVAVGDEVEVTISGARGNVTGTVSSIATSATTSGSVSNVYYAVVISIDNADGSLSSGSSAVVTFQKTTKTGGTE